MTEVRVKRSQYQQGSIRKVRKAKGYAWEVRFSEWLNGKRFQRTMIFHGTEYPKEADVRKAIELTVSQINSGTAGEKANAKFGAIITLYRRKFLPSESRLLELKKKLHKVFPADGALVDAFTVAREDELDEINLMLKAPATAENINLLALRLSVPNAPELEFSTREHHAHLLDHSIEPRFANVPIREMKVLMIDEWLLSLRGATGAAEACVPESQPETAVVRNPAASRRPVTTEVERNACLRVMRILPGFTAKRMDSARR